MPKSATEDSDQEVEGGINYGRVRHMWKGWVTGKEDGVTTKKEEGGKAVAKNNAVESKRWSCSPKDFGLLLLDFVFTQSVVNMLSTSAWRGIWNLWDLYLYGGLYLAEPWGPLDITGVFQVQTLDWEQTSFITIVVVIIIFFINITIGQSILITNILIVFLGSNHYHRHCHPHYRHQYHYKFVSIITDCKYVDCE